MFAICFGDMCEKELKIASLETEVENLKAMLEKEKKISEELIKKTTPVEIPKGMVDLTKIKFYQD